MSSQSSQDTLSPENKSLMLVVEVLFSKRTQSRDSHKIRVVYPVKSCQNVTQLRNKATNILLNLFHKSRGPLTTNLTLNYKQAQCGQ